MKTYVSSDGKREVWFDTHLKMWTMRNIDSDGNQIGDCDYTCQKNLCLFWLKNGRYPDLRQ